MSIKYKSISLPESLINQVIIVIDQKVELGYASVAEFIKDAVRKQIERIQAKQQENQNNDKEE